MEVFVISMNDDRFTTAETNLVEAGFLKTQIVRFPAVDGALVDLNNETLVSREVRTHLLGGESSSDVIKKNKTKLIPSRGALGCYLSHLKLWKQIAAEGNDAIIAEDDIVFRVSHASEQIESRWADSKKLGLDLLLLGSSKLPLLPSSVPGLFHVLDHFFGTEGYVLSAEGAKRLLATALPIKVQVDAYIGSFASSKKLKVGAVKPSISGQNHIFVSTVQPQTMQRKVLHAVRIHWLPVLLLVCICIGFLFMFTSSASASAASPINSSSPTVQIEVLSENVPNVVTGAKDLK